MVLSWQKNYHLLRYPLVCWISTNKTYRVSRIQPFNNWARFNECKSIRMSMTQKGSKPLENKKCSSGRGLIAFYLHDAHRDFGAEVGLYVRIQTTVHKPRQPAGRERNVEPRRTTGIDPFLTISNVLFDKVFVFQIFCFMFLGHETTVSVITFNYQILLKTHV